MQNTLNAYPTCIDGEEDDIASMCAGPKSRPEIWPFGIWLSSAMKSVISARSISALRDIRIRIVASFLQCLALAATHPISGDNFLDRAGVLAIDPLPDRSLQLPVAELAEPVLVPSLWTNRPSALELFISTSEQVVRSSGLREPTSRYTAIADDLLIM